MDWIIKLLFILLYFLLPFFESSASWEISPFYPPDHISHFYVGPQISKSQELLRIPGCLRITSCYCLRDEKALHSTILRTASLKNFSPPCIVPVSSHFPLAVCFGF